MHQSSCRFPCRQLLVRVGLALALVVPEVATAATIQPLDGGFAAFLAPKLEGKLNVNTATEDQWELLPGIGPSTAKKLVAYRSKHPFKEITHVMRIKGIGRKTFDTIRTFLTTQGATTLHVVGQSPGKGPAKKSPAKRKP